MDDLTLDEIKNRGREKVVDLIGEQFNFDLVLL